MADAAVLLQTLDKPQQVAQQQDEEIKRLRDENEALRKEIEGLKAQLQGKGGKPAATSTDQGASDDPEAVFERCLAKLEKAEVKEGDDPIIWAASIGDLELVKMLVDRGTCPNEFERHEGSEQRPAISLAALGGHLDVVKYLVEKGKTDRYVGNNMCLLNDGVGHCPLIHAIRGGDMDTVKYLVKCYYDENPQKNGGCIDYTSQHVSCVQAAKEAGQLHLVNYLRLMGSKETK